MPFCTKCGTGWPVSPSELKLIHGSARIHPKPCKCGNVKPNVGKKDKKQARTLLKLPPDAAVLVNPGGDLAEALDPAIYWLSTNESPVIEDYKQKIIAESDPNLQLKLLHDLYEDLQNVKTGEKVDQAKAVESVAITSDSNTVSKTPSKKKSQTVPSEGGSE